MSGLPARYCMNNYSACLNEKQKADFYITHIFFQIQRKVTTTIKIQTNINIYQQVFNTTVNTQRCSKVRKVDTKWFSGVGKQLINFSQRLVTTKSSAMANGYICFIGFALYIKERIDEKFHLENMKWFNTIHSHMLHRIQRTLDTYDD